MKSALLIFAILTAAQPAAKVERPCVECKGKKETSRWVWRQPWWPMVVWSKCQGCDGYGKERTIYGELLKGK
jgi:hypothetical protein